MLLLLHELLLYESVHVVQSSPVWLTIRSAVSIATAPSNAATEAASSPAPTVAEAVLCAMTRASMRSVTTGAKTG